MSIPDRPYWADKHLLKLPQRWAARMVGQWRKRAAESDTGHGRADAWLQQRIAEIEQAYRAGLTPAMDDDAICTLAAQEATDYGNHFATIAGKVARAWGHMPRANLRQYTTIRQASAAKKLMQQRGMADLYPDGPDMTPAGKLERLQDPAFWRKALRKAHCRTVEACAIELGFVRADRDCYVSRESLGMHIKRQAANAAMLANTIAVNEHGDERTLQELAERSVSNPVIRRGELMTRVAGFEACADALGHIKRWAVLTCPSRMHKYTRANGRTVENQRFDGTKPREAQAYLAQQWRRLCLWYERQGLRVYGFRTTEPHHDGCPHWNVLCFFAPMTDRVFLKKQCRIPVPAVAVFDAGLRRYFLENESPNEPGAQQRRVKIEAIEGEKGSAAAYIAKYISKGIDGHGMQLDLYGNPIAEASRAVVAWSRLWGIRQFQQIGGAPVTVWRELRRLHPENLGTESETPDTLRAAMAAVNLQLIEPGEKKAVAWMRYTNAQGGPTCKRKDWSVRLLRQEREGLNRYGEPAAARVVGVTAAGRVAVPTPAHMAHLKNAAPLTRAAFVSIESERAQWIVVPKADTESAFMEQCTRMVARIEKLDAAAADKRARISEVRLAYGEAMSPWTRVNNCTSTPTLDRLDRREPASPFAPLRAHRAKLGRFYEWEKRPPATQKGAEIES